MSKSEARWKLAERIGELFSILILAPWVGSLIWNWHFVPLYNLPRMEFWTAVLLGVVVKQFSYVRETKDG